jgi:hypothetical protein
MKLFLHCGYHKTGSSFLQSLFALNREVLVENGIWFPYSEREDDMLAGRISPGNATGLLEALNKGEPEGTLNFLAKCADEAKKRECSIVLLSAEGLFHSFGKEGSLENLAASAAKAGFDNIHGLVYFRDPVQHALSVYKHRGKRGTLPAFEDWINDGYETPGLQEKFLEAKDRYPIQWSVRKYHKDSEFMARSAFKEWLNIPVPELPEDDSVNPSLTLTEIELLRTIYETIPQIIPILSDELKKIPLNERKGDRGFERYSESKAAGRLFVRKNLFEKLNRIMPENESLILEVPDKDDTVVKPVGLSLTPAQVLVLARSSEIFYRSKRFPNRLSDTARKVVRRLKRIKNGMH